MDSIKMTAEKITSINGFFLQYFWAMHSFRCIICIAIAHEKNLRGAINQYPKRTRVFIIVIISIIINKGYLL